MFRVVVVCLLVALVSCQGPPPPGNEGCCTPDQWQGYVTGTSYVNEEALSEYVYYDYTNQRLRSDVVFLDNESHNVLETVLILADSQVVYITDYLNNQCVYYNSTAPLIRACAPPGDGFYDYTLGVTLNARSYFYNVGSTKAEFSVSMPECIPISGIFLSQAQDQEFAYAYFDVTLGIDDPLVFTPPSGCTKISPPS